MKLSSLYTAVPDYLEYAQVAAANSTQSISANTWTTLELNTEVADDGGHGALATNAVTLQPGTYYFEGEVPIGGASNAITGVVLGLFAGTTAISRSSFCPASGNFVATGQVKGQFTVATATAYTLKVLSSVAQTVRNQTGATAYSAAEEASFAVLRIWKLK